MRMVRWYGDAMLYRAIVIASSDHHYCIISTCLHVLLEKIATGSLCSLRLLWFIYHLSSIPHAFVKCIVLLITFHYNVCRLNFKKNSSVKESWTYIANQYEIFRSLLNDCRYGVKHYPINQSIKRSINQSINHSHHILYSPSIIFSLFSPRLFLFGKD